MPRSPNAQRTHRTNEAWIAALRGESAGDPIALAELAAMLRGALAKALHGRGIPEHDLDDLTQESLLQLLRYLPTFRGDSAFTTWATAVAIRVAFTMLRRRQVRERGHAALYEAQLGTARLPRSPAVAEDGAERSVLEALRAAVELELSERQRTAIQSELRGVPTIEIAEQLGINQNALYKLTHDARKRLRAVLLAWGYTREKILEALEDGVAFREQGTSER